MSLPPNALARQSATVSMLLTWGQLKRGVDPMRFTVRSARSLSQKQGMG
jgi:DNA primase